MSDSVRFEPRGLGKSWLPCMICDEEPTNGSFELKMDLASFVQSRGDGYRALAILADAGLFARLDYRRWEPNWIQVKMGACEEHEPILKRLYGVIFLADRSLSPAVIKTVKDHFGPSYPKEKSNA